MRPPITVTNRDRHGKVGPNWHVKIGNKWKTFTQQAWEAGGIDYINKQLGKA